MVGSNFLKVPADFLLMFNLQERDAFREIIQTYENEVTLSITSPLMAHRKQPNMKELDNMMTGYQKQVNSLEAELEKVRTQSMQDKTTIQQVRLVQGHKKFILCFSDTVRVTFIPPRTCKITIAFPVFTLKNCLYIMHFQFVRHLPPFSLLIGYCAH